MLKARRKAAGRRITAGEDKAYDTADHVANLRAHRRDAACDTEPGRHQNRQDPQQRHRRTNHAASRLWHVAIAPGRWLECIFGWGKQYMVPMRKTKHHRGIARVAADFLLKSDRL